MESTWSRPIPLSRAVWLRLGDGVLDVAQSSLSALHQLWGRWRAARQRTAEDRALRELSPTVLRDIGVEPERVHEAQRWRDSHDATRDTLLRSL